MDFSPNEEAGVRYVDNDILLRYISNTLRNGHKAVLRIKGNSMYPFLRNACDLVVLRTFRTDELKPGAIFLFQLEGQYILHRLIKIKNGEYWMRGDYNRTYERVVADNIIGIVDKVKRNNGSRVIDCQSLQWRLFSYCWMKSFPIHSCLWSILALYSRLCRRKSKVDEI